MIMEATDLQEGDIDLRVGGTIQTCDGCGALIVRVNHPELRYAYVDLDSPSVAHTCPSTVVTFTLTVGYYEDLSAAMKWITNQLAYQPNSPLDNNIHLRVAS